MHPGVHAGPAIFAGVNEVARTLSDPLPLPGLDVVGRGIYLRPHHPYELKRSLFEQRDVHPFHSREAGRTYLLPAGYEVNESPPPPTGVALNRVHIEESWERFARTRALDAGTAGGWLTFNVDVSAHVGHELRAESESFYGVRSSFVALWSVYLEDPSAPSHVPVTEQLPVPFSPAHRRIYAAFFERYGTHYVKRAWVGGKAEVMVRVAKTSTLSKEDIGAGLQASFGLPGLLPSGRVKRELEHSKQSLLRQSHIMVVGRGGHEHELAAMSSLDEGVYNAWLGTIRDNPQTVELGLAGIWNLVADPETCQALIDAYRAAATFAPISSVFASGDEIHLTRGHDVFHYDRGLRSSSAAQPLLTRWPSLAEHGFERVDAAFCDPTVRAPLDPEGASAGRADAKVFLFRRAEVLRLDLDSGAVQPGSPRAICDEWPGVEFETIDAAMGADTSLYFFSGKLYTRFNLRTGCVDPGYPARVCERWIGVTFDRIDAAIHWSDGKIYFFRGDHYICYDPVTLRAEPEFPKPIVGSYVEDWAVFE